MYVVDLAKLPWDDPGMSLIPENITAELLAYENPVGKKTGKGNC